MNAPPSAEPVIGQYVHVSYEGGFSRTGNVIEVNNETRESLVEFHYSNLGTEMCAWERLS